MLINNLTDNKLELNEVISFVKDRKGHDRRYAISSDKLVKQIGQISARDFEENMRRTILFYLNN